MLLVFEIALGVILGFIGSMVISILFISSKLYVKLMQRFANNYIASLESSYEE